MDHATPTQDMTFMSPPQYYCTWAGLCQNPADSGSMCMKTVKETSLLSFLYKIICFWFPH